MTRFEFSIAPKIVFGAGAAADIVALTREFGHRALVVHGHSTARAAPVIATLEAAGIATTPFAVAAEPDTELVTAGATLARNREAEFVLAVGGGSVIDTAKAVAALATNDGPVLEYLEVVGRGLPLTRPSLPCVAVPTTAGTGSEVTRNAVLGSRPHGVKVSLRGPYVLPKLAIVDPALTYDLPPSLTASSGLDALTQLLEAYLSSRANPMTDAFCQDGLVRTSRAIRRAFHDGRDVEARADMSLGSLWSGIALANAGLGAVHGFAGPIGGCFDAPHGAICAALLPHVFAANLRAVESRTPDAPVRSRFTSVARLLTGRPEATASDGVTWLEGLVSELHIPPLGSYGVRREHVEDLAAKSARANSMKTNPVLLTHDELVDVLTQSI